MSGKMDALDILASAVSHLEELDNTSKTQSLGASSPKPPVSEHRVSCHRCGNIRRKRICCPNQQCPHIFCGRCADKLRAEYGESIFVNGCPVCKDLCCCTVKTITCTRKNHCYRKCPASKAKKETVSVSTAAAAVAAVAAGALQSADLAALTHQSSAELTASIAAAMETFKVNTPALDFLAAIVTTANNKASKLTKHPSQVPGSSAPAPESPLLPLGAAAGAPPSATAAAATTAVLESRSGLSTTSTENAGSVHSEHDEHGSGGGRGLKRPLAECDASSSASAAPAAGAGAPTVIPLPIAKEMRIGPIDAQQQSDILKDIKLFFEHSASSWNRARPAASDAPSGGSSAPEAQLAPAPTATLAGAGEMSVDAKKLLQSIASSVGVSIIDATAPTCTSADDVLRQEAAPDAEAIDSLTESKGCCDGDHLTIAPNAAVVKAESSGSDVAGVCGLGEALTTTSAAAAETLS